MRAIAIDGYGLDHVKSVAVDAPAPGSGEVTVAVEAAALNHLDLWTLSGSLNFPHRWPHILGADAAGRIDAVGAGVTGLKPGAPVVVNPSISCRRCEFCRAGEQSLCTTFQMLGEHLPGTFAERVTVPATNVFPFADHLSFEEASALGVAFVTAYRMLFTRGRLKPGEWVLVTGIGGGLALALFQLARPVAGRIFVTSSSDAKIGRAIELGADDAINYRQEDVGKAIRRLTGKRGVDLVVDSAGGGSIDSALRSLCKGGRLVTAGATSGARADVDIRRVFWNQLEVIGSTMGSDRDVSNMLRMVAGIRLRPVVDRVFELERGRDALECLESQQQLGKVVLKVS